MGGDDSGHGSPTLDRRSVLKTTGAGVAGATTMGTAASAERTQDGDALRVGLGSAVDSFDPENSSDTTSSLAQSLIFEGLTVADKNGNVYPWLAADIEQVGVQDVGARDYEEYMTTFTAEEDEEGGIYVPVEGFEVLRHPDDEDPAPGDEVRVLTFEDAGEAVADGTFGMQYRFELREGVTFHDGTELTAEDVVASCERLKGSINGFEYFNSTLYYEGVDEYTVDIYAQTVDAAAVRELPPVVVHPADQAEIPLDELDPRNGTVPIGTGAYELTDYEDAAFWEYEKVDSYWVEELGVGTFDWFEGDPGAFPDGPQIDRIRLDIIEDDDSRETALREGEIDVATDFSASTLQSLDAADDVEVTITESGGYTYIQFPVQAEPWTDQRLRQAVNNLVPRQEIADNVFGGTVSPAWSMLPSLAAGAGTQDYEALQEDTRPFNEFDTERAEGLIEEVIDEKDLETPIEIQLEVNSDNDDRVQMLELIAESMEQTGYFDTTVKTFEWNNYVARILGPNYGIDEDLQHIACVGVSGTFNPHSFVDALHHSDNIGDCCNLTGIDEGWIDDAIDAARYDVEAAEDPDVRRSRYDEVLRDLEEYAGVAITHFTTQATAYNPEIENFDQWPFHEGYLDYALYAPQGEQYIVLPQLITVRDYANEEGVVDTAGLRDAVADWRRGDIDSRLLQEILQAWSSGERVA